VAAPKVVVPKGAAPKVVAPKVAAWPIHSAKNDETPGQIATHYRVDVDELVHANVSQFPNLKAGSKLYKGTQLIVPISAQLPESGTRVTVLACLLRLPLWLASWLACPHSAALCTRLVVAIRRRHAICHQIYPH
jgi:hypothetical protein